MKPKRWWHELNQYDWFLALLQNTLIVELGWTNRPAWWLFSFSVVVCALWLTSAKIARAHIRFSKRKRAEVAAALLLAADDKP